MTVTPIFNKMREQRLRCFGHVMCKPLNAPIIKKICYHEEDKKKGIDQPKFT